MTAYLAELNREQREAAEHIDGPLLVLAGAGTGKTRALTARVAHMLDQGVDPRGVMAVTFTNKAAKEMAERTANLAGAGASEVRFGTFHSLGARYLRRYAGLFGLTSSFTVIDTADQLRAAKQVLTDAGIDEKRWPVKQFVHHLNRLKDKGVNVEQAHEAAEVAFADGAMPKLYKSYQELLRGADSADFGDLLLYAFEMLHRWPDVLTRMQDEIRYILVDEYQDTNTVQYLWLRLLSQQSRNICCVGDDDQSIYGWRGAEVGNILRFDKDFPEAKVIRLERNYRSVGSVLSCASAVISCNRTRMGKTLIPQGEKGEPVNVVKLWDDREEARFVADEAEALRFRGHSNGGGTMAVLVRAGSQTRAFEEQFTERGLRYKVVGGLRFYDRQEVRDLIGYLRLINSENDDLAFERVINVPKRGLGTASLLRLRQFAKDRGVSCLRALALPDAAEESGIRGAAWKELQQFRDSVDRWRIALEEKPLSEVTAQVAEESGYMAMWRQEGTQEASARADNLRELARSLDRYEKLQDFLEQVGLAAAEESEETEEDRPRLFLMTLHAAKGLEFDTVFLPGWEEGLFPNQRASDESGAAGLEEERRLAYVGITRARKRLFITHAVCRYAYGQTQQNLPSRFLDELDEKAVLRQDRSGSVYGMQKRGGSEYGGFSKHGSYGRSGYGDGGGYTNGDGSTKRFGKNADDDAPSPGPRIPRVSKAGFQIGQRVKHKTFGVGTILSVQDDRLEVFFDTSGKKKLMDSFVERAIS